MEREEDPSGVACITGRSCCGVIAYDDDGEEENGCKPDKRRGWQRVMGSPNRVKVEPEVALGSGSQPQ